MHQHKEWQAYESIETWTKTKGHARKKCCTPARGNQADNLGRAALGATCLPPPPFPAQRVALLPLQPAGLFSGRPGWAAARDAAPVAGTGGRGVNGARQEARMGGRAGRLRAQPPHAVPHHVAGHAGVGRSRAREAAPRGIIHDWAWLKVRRCVSHDGMYTWRACQSPGWRGCGRSGLHAEQTLTRSSWQPQHYLPQHPGPVSGPAAIHACTPELTPILGTIGALPATFLNLICGSNRPVPCRPSYLALSLFPRTVLLILKAAHQLLMLAILLFFCLPPPDAILLQVVFLPCWIAL